MNREQKSEVIQSLKGGLADSQAAFVVGYQGLPVSALQKLRKQLRAQGGALHVAKARLMKRALDGVEGVSELLPFLKTQVCLVFAQKNVPAVAKVLYEFSKDNEALQLIAGSFESLLLDKNAFVRLASIPSREVLLARLCGALQAPITKLAIVLNMQVEQLKKQAQEVI